MTIMLSRLTGKKIMEVRNEHFSIAALIQSEFRELRNQFQADVARRLKDEDDLGASRN